MNKDKKSADIVDISIKRMKSGAAIRERRRRRIYAGVLITGLLLLTVWLDQVLDGEAGLEKTAAEPTTFTTEDGRTGIRVDADELGHYYVQGEVNGHSVVFMVDTGASAIHLPERVTRPMLLPVHGTGHVETANGRMEVTRTELSEVTIGGLRLENVRGSYSRGMNGNAALLGMTFLRHFDMRYANDQLEIVEKQ